MFTISVQKKNMPAKDASALSKLDEVRGLEERGKAMLELQSSLQPKSLERDRKNDSSGSNSMGVTFLVRVSGWTSPREVEVNAECLCLQVATCYPCSICERRESELRSKVAIPFWTEQRDHLLYFCFPTSEKLTQIDEALDFLHTAFGMQIRFARAGESAVAKKIVYEPFRMRFLVKMGNWNNPREVEIDSERLCLQVATCYPCSTCERRESELSSKAVVPFSKEQRDGLLYFCFTPQQQLAGPDAALQFLNAAFGGQLTFDYAGRSAKTAKLVYKADQWW